MPAPAIEVAGLTKHFRHRTGMFRSRTIVALDNVSFSVQSGEALGLIGPNGSGKSTLLRILSTVLLPTSGEAWVGGMAISQTSRVKPSIGFVTGEAKGFNGLLSGRQNLEFFAALQRLEPKDSRRQVEHLLEQIGLATLGAQLVETYSTGQRQRLNIARALLHDPPILLLDEPTKGLDPWVSQKIRRWIRHELIQRVGKTLLVASNETADIRELCDGVAFLEQGRLTQQRDLTSLLVLEESVLA